MAKAKTPRNGATRTGNLETPAVTAAQPEIKPAATKSRKPQVTRLAAQTNLDEEIRRRAYELWVQCGYQSGHENEHWLSAEREIRSRYTQEPQHTA